MKCVEHRRPITIGQKTCKKEAGYKKSTYTGSKLSKGSSSDAGNEHRSALTLSSFITKDSSEEFIPFLLFLKLPGDPDIFWVDTKSLTVKYPLECSQSSFRLTRGFLTLIVLG